MKTSNILLWALLIMSIVPLVYAESADLNAELSDEDKEKFDQILEPIMMIYNFIKYIASAIGAIFLLYAGITYMMSGSNPKKREDAKHIATYVVIGLMIIWATPLIIQLLI